MNSRFTAKAALQLLVALVELAGEVNDLLSGRWRVQHHITGGRSPENGGFSGRRGGLGRRVA
jgi:hypothetical protein